MLILQEKVIISDTQMRSLCEVTFEEENKDGDKIFKKGNFWLLHFGLTYDIVNSVSFTVAICEDCETGQLRCFLPQNLKMIGTEIKK